MCILPNCPERGRKWGGGGGGGGGEVRGKEVEEREGGGGERDGERVTDKRKVYEENQWKGWKRDSTKRQLTYQFLIVNGSLSFSSLGHPWCNHLVPFLAFLALGHFFILRHLLVLSV